MQDLRITLIQSNPVWHDIEKNLETLSGTLPVGQSEVILLPETFTTGFTMASDQMAEKMNGRTHEWMKEQSKRTGAALGGSIIIEEDGWYYNRFLWVEPDGKTLFYDKRHLFRMADENKYYKEGESILVINYKGWNLRPLICYDLRFPVWSRNIVSNGGHQYDALIYVASWPQPRLEAWDSLLKARAIENSAYTIGVSRVGKDGESIDYDGHSSVYGPRGEQLYFSESIESADTISISYTNLAKYRIKFPAHMDADTFDLK